MWAERLSPGDIVILSGLIRPIFPYSLVALCLSLFHLSFFVSVLLSLSLSVGISLKEYGSEITGNTTHSSTIINLHQPKNVPTKCK